MNALWSVSQLNSMGTCGHQYKLKFIDRTPIGKFKFKRHLGSAVGATIQQLVIEKYLPNQDSPITEQDTREMFASQLGVILDKAGASSTVIQNLQHLIVYPENPLIFFTYDTGAGVELTRKDFRIELDTQLTLEAPRLTWRYGALSASKRESRDLEMLEVAVQAAHNGFTTLKENGLLQGLVKAEAEFEYLLQGSSLSVMGFLDLVLHNAQGEVRVLEFKFSSAKPTGLQESVACEVRPEHISRDRQCVFYDEYAKIKWGSSYKGLFYLSTAYNGHILKYEMDPIVKKQIFEQAKIASTMRDQGLFVACCTGSGSHQSKMCDVVHQCVFVPMAPPKTEKLKKPRAPRKAK